MIYQTNSTSVEISMTPIEIHIILIIVVIFALVMLTLELQSYLSNKIHKSYHKGYNKAKSDKVQYYKTIKELTDSFKIILSELYKDNSKLSIITAQLLIDFKVSLQEYYSN